MMSNISKHTIQSFECDIEGLKKLDIDKRKVQFRSLYHRIYNDSDLTRGQRARLINKLIKVGAFKAEGK